MLKRSDVWKEIDESKCVCVDCLTESVWSLFEKAQADFEKHIDETIIKPERVEHQKAIDSISRTVERARHWVKSGDPKYAQAGVQILRDLGVLDFSAPQETTGE